MRQFALLGLCSAAVVTALTAFLVMGNPQWNRCCYICQAYIYPGEGYILEPSGHEGVWRSWYSNGQIQEERDHERRRWSSWYANGQKRSEYDAEGLRIVEWFENGQLKREEVLLAGDPSTIIIRVWHEDGTLAGQGFENDCGRHGRWAEYERSGAVRSETYYRNDEEISREEFYGVRPK